MLGASELREKADPAPSDAARAASDFRLLTRGCRVRERTRGEKITKILLQPRKTYSTFCAERKELIRNTNSPRLLLMGTVE